MKISIVRTLVSLVVSLLAQAALSLLAAHPDAGTPAPAQIMPPLGDSSAGAACQASLAPRPFH